MKIFISWSGEQSLTVAQTLKEWLPLILQGAAPWLSSEDICKGSRWQGEIATALQDTGAAILCLTRQNLASDWLLFEAGAVSKALAPAPLLVCTYLINLGSADVALPLGMFQGTTATRDDTLRMLRTLNTALEPTVPEQRLLKLFDRFWPDLEVVLKNVQASSSNVPSPPRDPTEVLDEILNTVRALARRLEPSWQYIDGLTADQTREARVRRLNCAFDGIRASPNAVELLEILHGPRNRPEDPTSGD
jgi:hypothetical protein